MLTTALAPAHLTAAQRVAFEHDGFFIVRGALDPEAVAHFRTVLRSIATEARTQRDLSAQDFIEVRHAVHADHRVLDLTTWPTVFPLVAELMGPDIGLVTTHGLTRPPQPGGTAAAFKSIGWHRDAGGQVKPMHGTCPWIYTKIGFYLSDCSQPDMGNLRVIPGSHRRAECPPVPAGAIDPEGAIQVLVAPGDAVIFHQAVWHAVGPNFAPHARENFYIGYGFRWVRPIDALPTPAVLMAKADPIQRQLLGEVASPLTWYLPQADDRPLIPWLEAHQKHAGTCAMSGEDAAQCG